MLAQSLPELADQHDVSPAVVGLELHKCALRAELEPHAEVAVVEVDIVPSEREQFADPHTGEQHQGDERPEAIGGAVEHCPDLLLGQDLLLAAALRQVRLG